MSKSYRELTTKFWNGPVALLTLAPATAGKATIPDSRELTTNGSPPLGGESR
jgi:hypothetical protein